MLQADGATIQSYGSLGELLRNRRLLEPQGQTADHAFWRTNHEQFVVDGAISGRIPEEIAHANQHFPPGAGDCDCSAGIDDVASGGESAL